VVEVLDGAEEMVDAIVLQLSEMVCNTKTWALSWCSEGRVIPRQWV